MRVDRESKYWRVVTAQSGRRFIGKGASDEDIRYFLEHKEGSYFSDWMTTLKDVLEIQQLMRPTPNGIERQMLCLPVDAADSPLQWMFFPAEPSEVINLIDVSAQVRDSYLDMVDQALANLEVVRAARAGITLASELPPLVKS